MKVNRKPVVTGYSRNDPWNGGTPPDNTPYAVVAKYRGHSYLRGWMTTDRMYHKAASQTRAETYKTYMTK